VWRDASTSLLQKEHPANRIFALIAIAAVLNEIGVPDGPRARECASGFKFFGADLASALALGE